jgi:uncharacterized protein YgbK (DUF1537 family)
MPSEWIQKDILFSTLPREWPVDLRPDIQRQVEISGVKVVVLDDDPTGTQTIYNIPVLTEWDRNTLKNEVVSPLPAFYLLTNTRSLPLERAQSINREIGRNLRAAAREANRSFVVVSRSDSTLRGHFPGEVDMLAESLGLHFDGWIINPFFMEGGRYTIGDIHYVEEGKRLVPAAETAFARDRVFGYASSNLRGWIEEKTGGRIRSRDVLSISIEDIRRGGPDRITDKLMTLTNGRPCVVNAGGYRDCEVFVRGLLNAEARGKHFLYRTAASFVQVRAGLKPRSLLTKEEIDLSRPGGGLSIVGSHVPRTTAQLTELLHAPEISPVEIHVKQLLDKETAQPEIDRVAIQVDAALQKEKDAVIYTTRQPVQGKKTDDELQIGRKISTGLTSVLLRISERPRYIIAKGGITASDLATGGMGVKRAMVLGQIVPGVPVWRLGMESRFPNLPYVIFPGNVGDDKALKEVFEKLRDVP